MDAYLYSEVLTQKGKEFSSIDVRIQRLRLSCQYQDRSIKVDHNRIHDRKPTEGIFNCGGAIAKNSEELSQQIFELSVAEDLRIVVLVENKFEIFVVDDLFDTVDVVLVIYAFQLETEFEVLIVEDSDVGLRVIFEYFDHSCRVEKVVFEK